MKRLKLQPLLCALNPNAEPVEQAQTYRTAP